MKSSKQIVCDIPQLSYAHLQTQTNTQEINKKSTWADLLQQTPQGLSITEANPSSPAGHATAFTKPEIHLISW